MLRRRKPAIGGIELPEEYTGARIIDTVAIRRDGKKYARISEDGELSYHRMPKDGRIDLGDMVVTYVKQSWTSRLWDHVRKKGIPKDTFKGSYTVSGKEETMILHFAKEPRYEIDESYPALLELSLENNLADVCLSLTDRPNTYISGLIDHQPEEYDGTLHIKDMVGDILMPSEDRNLSMRIKTTIGMVYGDIAHKGSIMTATGDILLDLHSALACHIYSANGKVEVMGMEDKGDGRYIPPGHEPSGILNIRTASGNVDITYKA